MNRVDLEEKFWEDKAFSKDVDREMHDPWLSTEEELKIITDNIPNEAREILEIGSGVGRLIIPLAKMFEKRYFSGIDISNKVTEIAGTRCFNAHCNNLYFMKRDGRSLPFGPYGFIYSVTVFQHIDQEGIESYFSEVGRALRKDGIFLFQFIEGVENEPMSHHYPMAYVVRRLEKSGMELVNGKQGLIHPTWTWITARKL